MDVQFLQHHLLKSHVSFTECFFTFDKNQLGIFAWVISRFSVLLHWSTYLTLHQHNLVLIIVATYLEIQYSGFSNFILPFQIVFALIFCFNKNIRIIFSVSSKILLGFWQELILYISLERTGIPSFTLIFIFFNQLFLVLDIQILCKFYYIYIWRFHFYKLFS